MEIFRKWKEEDEWKRSSLIAAGLKETEEMIFRWDRTWYERLKWIKRLYKLENGKKINLMNQLFAEMKMGYSKRYVGLK